MNNSINLNVNYSEGLSIPTLPNEIIFEEILPQLDCIHLLELKTVSRKWKEVIEADKNLPAKAFVKCIHPLTIGQEPDDPQEGIIVTSDWLRLTL